MAISVSSTFSITFVIAGILWRLYCVVLRRRRDSLVAHLHPVQHVQAIFMNLWFVEFPFIFKHSLEYSFFRSSAIPSISRIMKQSGNLSNNSSKRFDDTDIILRELVMHHVDGDRGSVAIRRLNFIHSRYKINNADLLYVLSLLVIEQPDWISKYGYRNVTQTEKNACYTIWHDIGVRMGIKNIPASFEGFALYKQEYEANHMLFAKTNTEVGDVIMKLFLTSVPQLFEPLTRRLMYAFMDDRSRKAFGYPQQPAWLTKFVHSLLKLHGFVVSFLPPRPLSKAELRIPAGCPVSQGPSFDPGAVRKLSFQQYAPYVYREGYKLNELGPSKVACLGDPCPGDLLFPLSMCDNVPWPVLVLQKPFKAS
ncbi:hypothetical protein KP509_24G042500 [Ceratopteris richardii]|uniref:ER-bound oxygenase mpaB/mpaB'/Rubber oxygenase catalytic domain-containing protein n=1 Tax=Ceratopteris richardii TaxID=49495 RepID=A0A8T2RX45_CERRI|nr:hypothetical protein KP509_24G042500 [Ceratopteris richardii]